MALALVFLGFGFMFLSVEPVVLLLCFISAQGTDGGCIG